MGSWSSDKDEDWLVLEFDMIPHYFFCNMTMNFFNVHIDAQLLLSLFLLVLNQPLVSRNQGSSKKDASHV